MGRFRSMRVHDALPAVLSNRAEGGVAVKLVHAAAVRGDKEGLMAALRKAPDSVHTKDAMGRVGSCHRHQNDDTTGQGRAGRV